MKQKKTSTFEFLPSDIDLTLDEKIEKIDFLIKESLRLSKKPLLLFSGGSDSLLLLAFLLKHKPDIDVFYIDMRMNFPEYNKIFEEKIKHRIKNLHHHKIKFDEKEFVENFGIPIYPGVEEMGYPQEEFGRIGINNACSRLKKEIMNRELEKIKPDLTFMGFLATDKPKRYNRALSRGYLQLGNGENLCIPIAMLKKEEVFQILDKMGFPYVKDTYFNKKDGHLHKGDGVCWMCSAKCFDNSNLGNWDLLRDNYPELWQKIKNYGLKEKIIELHKNTRDKTFEKALEKYFNEKDEN